MKIQTRLSIISSALWGIVFIVVSLLIFGLYKRNIENSVYRNLKKTSQIIGHYFFEEDEVSPKEFLKIKKQYEKMADPDYEIYDEDNQLVYGNTPDISVSIIENIRLKKKLMFTTENFLCYGVYYNDNQGDFVIITKEKKKDVYNYINPLIWILLSAFILGLLATVLLNKWIANIAYRPIRDTIKQVKEMSPGDSMQLTTTHTVQDELYDLTETFNELLSKISDTFKIQQNFVSYVSHEFKTPLTAIQGNLEVFSLKDRTPEEYHTLTDTLISEIQQLEEILETLLIVSDLRKNTDISEQIRIDEMIFEIIKKVSGKYPDYTEKLNFEWEISPEREDLLQINIDKTQLFIALFNLIENAVKFSKGNGVNIKLFEVNKKLGLTIQDHGIGIPEKQLSEISKPFYRAENAGNISGKGIGLSIALRIFEKNSINYKINSIENKGTEINLSFL
ncbi:HAMP domain-containing sensor histidine kinase [Apibacter raozihei]|uniref:sensor histidine kinase n=1 Tax=Apibacter raozihei TaxID=2500547 RepID=UPI000FE38854|nr:HAMP domain-containing sensor histidine kinase [Apibacter raozihei]